MSIIKKKEDSTAKAVKPIAKRVYNPESGKMEWNVEDVESVNYHYADVYGINVPVYIPGDGKKYILIEDVLNLPEAAKNLLPLLNEEVTKDKTIKFVF